MKSLFWRSFLAFWLVMAAVVAGGVALTAAVTSHRYDALDDLDAAALMQQARDAASEKGLEGVRQWIADMGRRHPVLRVYVVDESGADILGRDIHKRLRDWFDAHQQRLLDAARARRADSGGADAAQDEAQGAGKALLWAPQVLFPRDAPPLLMRFSPSARSQWEVLGTVSYVPLALILFALAVSTLLCWGLARYVSQPVRGLQQAAHALADGRLDARTPRRVAARSDELGQLARDFDVMAQRLQQLLDTHERLLRNVAHELRSPLARQQLALELARRKDASLDAQLDRIEREARRLDHLVGYTLQLATLADAQPQCQPLDLCELLDGVVRDARFEAQARHMDIAWNPPGPIALSADAMRLRSAIENVLRNAIRYAVRSSGAAIQVTLAARSGAAVVDITDNGPGVPPDQLERIFKPFHRVRDGRESPDGAGLGLSIAQAAVAAHGGSITARNMQAWGHLRVSIELPLAPATARPRTDTYTPLPPDPAPDWVF